MQEFEVTVNRTDKFKIKIDENKINQVIQKYNEYFAEKLDKKDEVENLVKYIGAMSMNNTERYFEGLGTIIIDNLPSEDWLGYDEDDIVKGVEIETISSNYINTNIEEIK